MNLKESGAALLLRYSLYAAFAGIAALIVTLPFRVDFYLYIFLDRYFATQYYRVFITVFLIIAGLLAEWLVVEVIRMLRTIPTGPFVSGNTRALRRVGILFLVITALFVFKGALFPTFLTWVLAIIMLLCGLLAFTLSDLFRQAVAFREENDLTI